MSHRKNVGVTCALALLIAVVAEPSVRAFPYGYSGATTLSAGTLTLSSGSITFGGQLSINDATTQQNSLTTALPTTNQVWLFASGSQAGRPVDGIPGTYQPNYDSGFSSGYSNGYSTGFAQGGSRGTGDGTANGNSDGYTAGWDKAYQPAFDSAYSGALPVGQAAGWKQGIVDGFAQGCASFMTFMSSGSISVSNSGHYPRIDWGSISGSVTLSGGGFFNPYYSITVDDLSAYYHQLGYDDGNGKGLATGDNDGYNAAYPAAYSTAYPIGVTKGSTEGELKGTSDGNDKGFAAGWGSGYGEGFNSGFWDGVRSQIVTINLPSAILPTPIVAFDFPSTPSFGAIEGFSFDTAPVFSVDPLDANVPEPATAGLFCLGVIAISMRQRRHV